ncbi:MAG TPA: ferritin-like domain-containing protein [Burkholderiales bacterium]|nr:ferritin-like domain-containing protein [Burkholderiales bacterium]
MAKSTQMGMNRTGAQMSPKDVKQMQQDAGQLMQLQDTQVQVGSEFDAIEMRLKTIQEADPVGSVPLPGTMKGAMKAGMQKLSGRNAEVFLDKLGERLAYERTGVRLYEAFIVKCRADAQPGQVNLSIDQLLHIHNEEARHFKLLSDAMEKLGADPTAMTPCANTTAVQSIGILQVLTDPRTTIAQCLNAMLTVELTDNAAWELLIQLANEMGQDEMAAQFEEALASEEEHLAIIKQMLQDAVIAEAG